MLLRPDRVFLFMAPPALLGACAGQQSALEPDGRNASEVAVLWWSMLAAGGAIFVLVLVLLLYAMYRAPERRWRISSTGMIVAGGVVLPVLSLSILLPFGLIYGTSAIASLPAESLRIHVTGRQWWWEVEYVDDQAHRSFTTANEIAVPVGRPVELVLSSADVIHSFWVPRLAGKQDLVPGRSNRLVIEATAPGLYRGQCAEFCGLAHAQMGLYVLALPAEEFDGWMERQRRPAPAPESAMQKQGAAAFASSGCVLCHTVRGHDAWGQLGPDLTHLGSRRTIGAAVLVNDPESIAAWIAHNEAIKPGNRMPDFTNLERETRLAIGAYLAGLE